jgi:hypothetical protein
MATFPEFFSDEEAKGPWVLELMDHDGVPMFSRGPGRGPMFVADQGSPDHLLLLFSDDPAMAVKFATSLDASMYVDDHMPEMAKRWLANRLSDVLARDEEWRKVRAKAAA